MRAECRQLLLCACLMLAPVVCSHASPGNAPPRTEVEAAAARVARDPNLPGSITVRKLRLRDDDAPETPARPAGDSLQWLVDLLQWMTEAARLVVWVAGALAVALLLVGIRHWIKVRAQAAMPPRAGLPSHVQSLDIRPESLPDEVGAAAAQLWQQGERRAALSLLYRGALSRLVHDHQVPIRAATTEGECVTIASTRLDLPAAQFFARLVRAWQLAVYGARMPADQDALALCSELDSVLPPRKATPAA